MADFPERDWKYLRCIHDEMLETLSQRMNDELRAVLARTDISENEKRGEIYDLVKKRDRVVADCFDDWRRSTIALRCAVLKHEGLLTPEHMKRLAPETQEWLKQFG
ncbi:MAG: hypothetical protein V4773_08680 [Verrucomicrobiota bacterium]